jgi:hypothetical protein
MEFAFVTEKRRNPKMPVHQEAPAVAIARAPIEAWSNHDFETARRSLAPDFHVTATTTAPIMAPVDLTGIDKYMEGLIIVGPGVIPGSARIIASEGDERNALIFFTVTAAFGPNAPQVKLPGRGATFSMRRAKSRLSKSFSTPFLSSGHCRNRLSLAIEKTPRFSTLKSTSRTH